MLRTFLLCTYLLTTNISPVSAGIATSLLAQTPPQTSTTSHKTLWPEELPQNLVITQEMFVKTFERNVAMVKSPGHILRIR